ncbi:glycosyltransferase family protein [Spirosoma fluviale]|uniref:Glycosyltransferase involved in cell wall bisynthesis n=1 Tax=Spirosoma fluviale TaxID=1597977 RepID=A0A286FDB6_9BACT|nr:glycosyltransferase family 1 protein [Spirosoma fluviale]SOD81225.1 Glycosyltransferase involved in cell wall bisynthesis [Spirosoma fluviale]
MKKVQHHSFFKPNPFGHGGERRTTQIIEHYKENGFEIESVLLKPSYHFKLQYFLKSFLLIKNAYGLFRWSSARNFFTWWKYLYLIYPSLEKSFSTGTELFIWESTSDFFYFLPYFAKKMGKKVHAYPHNIESLVKGHKSTITAKNAPNGYLFEINTYKICDKLFSISIFDHQLFLLFNINSEFFPYHPPKELKLYLNSIKKLRKNLPEKNSKIKHYLIAGTVHNHPTKLGMEMLINWLINNPQHNCKFTVAGYGTEMFKNVIKNDNIEVLGTLSHEEMENTMIHCDALLVNHIPTTGILTRVIEFNTAGIPVVINNEAAYSFLGMSGIHVFTAFESITDLQISHFNKLQENKVL